VENTSAWNIDKDFFRVTLRIKFRDIFLVDRMCHKSLFDASIIAIDIEHFF
jgi:hypothetical protein